MPRRTSQSVKKETAVAESKTEEITPRRSGRAAAKQDSSTTTKEAIRSRRSSTAAQTAASVADSKSVKGKNNATSQRESTSPSDSRSKTNKDGGLESPATRVKVTRRSTSRINYKESDGEEETAAPKYDDNFVSTDEFDESDSDEKSKAKSRGRAAKNVSKSRGVKEKAKNTRGRRGRPSKKKTDEEESETYEISDDSVEPENANTNKKSKDTPVKDKQEVKNVRSRRKTKTDASEEKSKPAVEEKSKPSRRSSRSASNKEEPPRKRPSRSLQAKRYTEDDDDEDIEEITETKMEEDTIKTEGEGSRKRKRTAASEANKRLKEAVDEDIEKVEEQVTGDKKDEVEECSVEAKDEEKAEKNETVEEPMDVDSVDSVTPTEVDKSSKENEESQNHSNEVETENKKNVSEDLTTSKEKIESNKQESIGSSENFEESIHSSDSEQESRAEQSLSSGLEDSQESKIKDQHVCEQKSDEDKKSNKQSTECTSRSENFHQSEDNFKESKSFQSTTAPTDQTNEKSDTNESSSDCKNKENNDVNANDLSVSHENKITVPDHNSDVNSSVMHSKELDSNVAVNGSEKSSVITASPVIHSSSTVTFDHNAHSSTPKANGAHDDLPNSESSSSQYLLPGRKYVLNSKLAESMRNSLKEQTFGFISYNLDASTSDGCLQKEKLLKELNMLNAHMICIQQVSKSFYNDTLEPSLDALGFKGIFSQPEEDSKGVATFYKSSFFRLSGQSEVSLNQLIEKELESSSLDPSDRLAVKSHIKRCGHVLFTHFSSVIGTRFITVANVQIPPTDINMHALQVSCLAREIIKINGDTNKPLLLGGEFNMIESGAPYQLLRDGYLSNDMIEELQRRKDVVLPGKENASLLNLLWKSFQHPSSNLCSCYKSVLDQEVFIPEKKITSPDLLWYSSDSLHTVGVLNIMSEEAPSGHHFPLKADIAFFV